MTAPLSACPHCGRPPATWPDGTIRDCFACRDCDGFLGDNDAWNHRPIESSLAAANRRLVARLEKAVAMLKRCVDAMESEAMYCPGCTTGYLLRGESRHDVDCDLTPLLSSSAQSGDGE